MQSERSLVNKLLKDLKKQLTKSWWRKIPDPTVCPKCNAIAVGEKRPFDIMGTHRGRFIAIEVKVHTIKHLQPHQDAALRLVDQAHGLALVAVGDKVYHLYGNDWAQHCEMNLVTYIEMYASDNR